MRAKILGVLVLSLLATPAFAGWQDQASNGDAQRLARLDEARDISRYRSSSRHISAPRHGVSCFLLAEVFRGCALLLRTSPFRTCRFLRPFAQRPRRGRGDPGASPAQFVQKWTARSRRTEIRRRREALAVEIGEQIQHLHVARQVAAAEAQSTFEVQPLDVGQPGD